MPEITSGNNRIIVEGSQNGNNSQSDIDAALAAFSTGSTNNSRVQGYIRSIQQSGWGYNGDNSIQGAAAAYLQQAGFTVRSVAVEPIAAAINPASTNAPEVPSSSVTPIDTISQPDTNSNEFDKLIDLYRETYGHADSSPQPTYQVVGDATPQSSGGGNSIIAIIFILGLLGAGYYFLIYKKKGANA